MTTSERRVCHRLKIPQRVVVIGLGLARQDRARRVEKTTELRGAGARRQRFGDGVREREHPCAIPAAQRDMHEQQRGVDRVVELGELAGADPHQTAVIEADHQRLGAFGDELGRHEPASPSGGAPVDGAQRIVGKRVAHSLELAAFGAESHRAQADLRELAATRERLVDVDGGEVRDRHGPCRG